jgi:hypothetical protein
MGKLKISRQAKQAAKRFITRIKTGVLKPNPEPTSRRTTEERVKLVMAKLRKQFDVNNKVMGKEAKIINSPKKTVEEKFDASEKWTYAAGLTCGLMIAMTEVAKEFGDDN